MDRLLNIILHTVFRALGDSYGGYQDVHEDKIPRYLTMLPSQFIPDLTIGAQARSNHRRVMVKG
jgi:hypothetical protein